MEKAVINGDLILTGTTSRDLTFANITVTGNLDISGASGHAVNLNGVEVKVETTL